MRFLRILFLLTTASMLAACQTMLQGQVSTFHTLDGKPLPTFTVVPLQNQEGSLQFQTYAQVVRQNLIQRGFKEAPPEQAAVAVFLVYRIDDGTQVTSSYPIWGQTGTRSSYTTGSVSTYGNTATYQGTTTNTPQYGVVGAGVRTDTVYRRVVNLDMVDRAATTQQRKLVKVYEATVVSDGSTGELTAVMPTLLTVLFQEFPAPSGSVRKATVPMAQ